MRAFTIGALAAAVALAGGEWGAVPDGPRRMPAAHRRVPLPTPHAPAFDAVVLPRAVRDSMRARWEENNRHWDELSDVNTLTQLLGTGKPTQREYLGCLRGEISRDTLWIRSASTAHDLKQLQFAVAGSCDGVAEFVGTWHTHPYRADSGGRAIKERELSRRDLETFAAARDLVTIVMWDSDSLDAAARRPDGTLLHPVPLAVR